MVSQKSRKHFNPLHVWRLDIDPARNRKFWMVAIYETEEEMNEWLSTIEPPDPRRFLACCVGMRQRGIPDCLGYIVFSKEYMGGGIVAHEMFHAVCRYLETDRRGLKTMRREERFALLLEWMVVQFWTKWYRYAERVRR